MQFQKKDKRGNYNYNDEQPPSSILDKIILIQSAWRGRWLRKYIYDIIYLSFLHQRFCDILEKVMVSHVRPIVWEELFGYKKWAKERLARLLLEKDKRFTFLRLRPWFNRWRDAAKFLSKRNLKSKRLVNKKELATEWDKQYNEVQTNLKRRDESREIYDHYDKKMEELVRKRTR